MCLILFAWHAHRYYPLIVAANRDEFFHRPTAPAHFWTDQSGILAGRDLEQGGTWLGLKADGRFAAVTNFRKPGELLPGAPSRGLLINEFLTGAQSSRAYLEALIPRSARYNGFNLLASDGQALWHYSNRGGPPQTVSPGIHGLSNHLLDTAWPKVVSGKSRLQQLIARDFVAEDLLALLDDTAIAPDDALPATGLSVDRERLLSAARIVSPGYGTRCSTVVRIRRDGGAEFCERSFREDGTVADTVSFGFRITGAPERDA
jgi:uncharacterized protein with NRDE domain